MLPIVDASTARNIARHNKIVIEEIMLLSLHINNAVENNNLTVLITATSTIDVMGITITGTPMTTDAAYNTALTEPTSAPARVADIQTVETYFRNYGYSMTLVPVNNQQAEWHISW